MEGAANKILRDCFIIVAKNIKGKYTQVFSRE